MNIVIGSDHGGMNLKSTLVKYLKENDYEVTDIGPYSFESVDYPSYAVVVSNYVVNEQADFGILCCGTGIGMSIAANKIKGIRAAVVGDTFSAEATRAHNNSNVLCLGERVIGEGLAVKILETWLNTNFEGGRHERRIDKISDLEGQDN
ncbi:ribose 5-phosphate isomerase B [Marinilactibacillus sp. 15R]|uniref:Ribose-5-phosphate isomerase n=1 Tax=Marinilactibacillus piezotolerans TaxID=258723 RepID=A0A1I3YHC9_9LACT|nr:MULTISPECIES: ribose 5-phosphate isomerase B [Marinilactibacillus]API89690.1 ribose 5-phosphate isomerase B [Marinilactibacillus sp. 15R]SFK31268.1 ribose-5-phosphate isomerase [Marinilactibacillus piezotolerans]